MSSDGVKYRGAGFVVLLDAESPRDRSRYFAPVLERMVEILGAKGNEHVPFGQALGRASRELNIPIPEDMHEPLLRSAFIVIGGKRIPGAPDA